MTNTEQLRVALLKLIDRDGSINAVDAAGRFFTTPVMVEEALAEDVRAGEILVERNRRTGVLSYSNR